MRAGTAGDECRPERIDCRAGVLRESDHADRALSRVADQHREDRGVLGMQAPHAFVVAETRAELAEELRAFVRERLEPYKHPREVVFMDALPRTHLGKVDRGRLRGGR